MYRYVAMIWDAADARRAKSARLMSQRLADSSSWWKEVFSKPGLQVFCADIQRGCLEPHVLARGAGVVLGASFARPRELTDDAPCPRTILDERATDQILDSRGEWLVRNAWGNYVALICEPGARAVAIVKDPMGDLPAFATTSQDITVVCSALADCRELGISAFTVNRRYLEVRVSGGDMTSDFDALNEVTQIRRGECVEIDPRARSPIVQRRFYWTPFHFQDANDLIDDVNQARRALRSSVQACVSTWTACHRAALLRLSGGLDSSIVLGCIDKAAPRLDLHCYTQYAEEDAYDPRRWARIAAEHVQRPLNGLALRPAAVDLESMLEIAPAAEPGNSLAYLLIGDHEQRLAATHHANAVFTGDGGDGAFGSLCRSEVLAAQLHRDGITARTFVLASQSARVTNRTTWTQLRTGLHAWLTHQSVRSMGTESLESTRLVTAALRAEGASGRHVHPWFRDMHPLPWEPASKVGVLLGTPNPYIGVATPSDHGPQVISPIASQPVMELSLRIPADILFEDGRDRGLARNAFEGLMPAAILDRTWKDRPTNFHEIVIANHRDWLRQIFLEGVLVNDGLLDRAAVERALSSSFVRTDVSAAEILRHLETEVWAQRWSDGLATATASAGALLRNDEHRALVDPFE